MTNSVKLSSRGRVTIPQEIRRELNIKPQTEFTVTAADGKIVLTHYLLQMIGRKCLKIRQPKP